MIESSTGVPETAEKEKAGLEPGDTAPRSWCRDYLAKREVKTIAQPFPSPLDLAPADFFLFLGLKMEPLPPRSSGRIGDDSSGIPYHKRRVRQRLHKVAGALCESAAAPI
jgi:hypothetical protein